MPLRACLFDFDGTFADTAPGLINAANAIYKKYGKPLLSYEQGRVISSDGTQAFLRQRFDESEDNFSSLTLEFLQFYNKHILDEVDLFPGTSEFLSHLKDKKIAWGIVTNKPRVFTETILNHFNLMAELAILICGDDGYKSKPAPDMLNVALEKLMIQSSEMIYIGDGKRDIDAAQLAGVQSVLVSYGYINPDDDYHAWGATHIIDNLQELNFD